MFSLTGADTVVFYDSDFNPQMDRQCEDRAHRIGQIRDVHIYRFVSKHTVEEALLRKANQKRSLDDLVIQQGEFDWRTLFGAEDGGGKAAAIVKAMGVFEDGEDARAAVAAATEENVLLGEDAADFEAGAGQTNGVSEGGPLKRDDSQEGAVQNDSAEDDEGIREVAEYMLDFVEADWEYFRQFN